MLNWQRRIALNSLKACIPAQTSLRRLLHSISPPVPGEHHELLLDGIIDQISMIQMNGGKIQESRVLEIGSGWIPVAPLMFRLAGARQVLMSDAHRLLHPRSVKAAVDFLLQRSESLSRRLGVDRSTVEDLLGVSEVADLDEMLAMLGLDYLVPLDDDTLRGDIDIAYSHTVLEHIPPSALAEIFALVRQRLVPGGLFCNGIDNSDHRRSYDNSLSIIDFLKYSDFAWKLQCINPQDYTNRLRHSDYISLLAAANFEVLEESIFVARRQMANLDRWELPPRFRSKDSEDLCTTWSLILSRA